MTSDFGANGAFPHRVGHADPARGQRLHSKETAMSHDLFVMGIPILEKIIRTVAVYAVILVLFRLSGKRGLAQLTSFDMVVVFLLSNVVQNAIIGNDNSLLGGSIGAVTLVVVNMIVTRSAAGSSTVERVLEGTPTTVIKDGQLDRHAAWRIGLRAGELEQAVRMQNGDSVSDVGLGRLEPTGQLILTLKPDEQPMTRGDMSQLLERLDRIESHLTG
jgi:uncharacterized membrane protein YcaP (DUF421 family)